MVFTGFLWCKMVQMLVEHAAEMGRLVKPQDVAFYSVSAGESARRPSETVMVGRGPDAGFVHQVLGPK